MKKPILATVGVAGACAACCAIPILLPLASGLSVAGLVGFDWEQLGIGREMLAVAAGSLVAAGAGLGLWTVRRRRTASACASQTALQERQQPQSSCGCSGSTKTASAGSPL